MSEVLSQSEIDALLSALTSGEVKAEDIRDSEQTSRVRNYDFRRAMRFSKDHIRIISRIHEHFCRLLSTHLSGQLRSVVQLQVESVDQVPYEEFIRSIPVLTVIQVYAFNPLEGKVIMEINPQIVFAMLDRLMGGMISGPYKERELTDIEQALIKRILGRITEFFSDAWHNVAKLNPEFVSMESNPQFLQLTTPNETVLVITLSAKVGEAYGLINLCIPHVTVEPIMSRLSTQYFMDGSKEKQRAVRDGGKLEQHIQDMFVNVAVELGTSEITVEEALGMQIGDTIPLSQSIRDPVLVYVDGVPAYSASLGKLKNRYAVKIIEDWNEVSTHDRQREIITGRD